MSEKQTAEKAVLDPDHPLLEKFQKALKEHYLHQINRLKDEIYEIEAETKQKNAEREAAGIQTYEAQQMVCKQQKTLEEIGKDLQNITAAKEEMENQLQEEKEKYKDLKEEFISAEKTSFELRHEINSVNLLIRQISEWENKIESELVVNQRIAEKTRKDKLKLVEEKKKQDLQIYNVMNVIWKLESEIETMNIQIRLKETEKEELEHTTVLGNANLEALQAEYRCLMHSWNSVVVAIGNRDKIMDCLRAEESTLREKIRNVTCETEMAKKITKKEMNDNERFIMNKSRIEQDITNCKQQMDDELATFTELENTLHSLQEVFEQTERDIATVVGENHAKKLAIAALTKDYERIVAKKFAIEQTLLKDLENQATNDKMAGNLHRILNATKEKRKDLEVILSEAENKQSLMTTEVESQKFNNEANARLLEDISKEHADLEKEADSIEAEKSKYELLFKKKEGQVTVLNSKFELILGKTDLKALVSPQELRIVALEKQIEETQDRIKNLQRFWLREQRNLLNVAKERQEQVNQLNLLKKQNLILEQKNLQISNEIENYKKSEEKILRNINNLQNKTTALCDTLFKKRGIKSNLDKTNYYLQSQYDGKLKDCEIECLKIEASLAEFEDDKVNLSKELINVNKEVLEWEKKVKLAKDTKNEIKGEQGKGGDLENMKQEIQRMNVIYAQLKKAQDKLIKDLGFCVSRRDAIFTVAEARQKKSKSTEDRTKINFSRKMDDVRNQIKRYENEMKSIGDNLKQINAEKDNTSQEIESVGKKIKLDQEYIESLTTEIENRKTNRQLKFELLLLVQKKLQIYNDLAAKKVPYMHYKKDSQMIEYNKEKDINNKLCQVVENLTADFPSRSHLLTRLYNSLKLNILAAYHGKQ